jgi:redox-sensing transcriptional repressor
MGFVRVFSDNLADTLGVSSSLIRKDFSHFGIKGHQKGGYYIDTVLEKIREIIGFDKEQKVIVVGAGRIGEALLRYEGFRNDRIDIVAGFDIDRNKTDEEATPPILHMEELGEFIRKNRIRVAILAVPVSVTQSAIEKLQESKVEGILNFTPLELKSTSDMMVRNIDIKVELANLIYSVKQLKNNGNNS